MVSAARSRKIILRTEAQTCGFVSTFVVLTGQDLLPRQPELESGSWSCYWSCIACSWVLIYLDNFRHMDESRSGHSGIGFINMASVREGKREIQLAGQAALEIEFGRNKLPITRFCNVFFSLSSSLPSLTDEPARVSENTPAAMEYRGKYNPKIVFPSFSLVVNRLILHRPARQPVARKKEFRLVWVNVPEYEPEPVPVPGERVTDWAMVRASSLLLLFSASFCWWTAP